MLAESGSRSIKSTSLGSTVTRGVSFSSTRRERNVSSRPPSGRTDSLHHSRRRFSARLAKTQLASAQSPAQIPRSLLPYGMRTESNHAEAHSASTPHAAWTQGSVERAGPHGRATRLPRFQCSSRRETVASQCRLLALYLRTPAQNPRRSGCRRSRTTGPGDGVTNHGQGRWQSGVADRVL